MSLELIIGSMFSGKSTELVRRVRRLTSINYSVIVVNSALDNRYNASETCTTHSGVQCNAVKLTSLRNLTSRLVTIGAEGEPLPDVVAVDEGQFFDDLYESVLLMVETLHLRVIVAGLVGDYKRNHFGDIHKLLPYADEVQMCRAYCAMCSDGTKASFTKRLQGGDAQVEVGTGDKYAAVCRRCYIK